MKLTLPFTCYQFWIVCGFIVNGFLWYLVGWMFIYHTNNPMVTLPILLGIIMSLFFLLMYGIDKNWEFPLQCKCK